MRACSEHNRSPPSTLWMRLVFSPLRALSEHRQTELVRPGALHHVLGDGIKPLGLFPVCVRAQRALLFLPLPHTQG